MKVSIITAVYNGEDFIESAIQSVLSQTNVEIEYIIIDGKSTDNTLNIIDKYRDKISKVISEKDAGIYDAMNKGINLATGDIIGILNSDDFYTSNSIVSEIVNKMKESNSDMCYGDLLYVDRKTATKKTRFWKPGIYKERKLNHGWIPPHPSLFVTKDAYKKIGLFNTTFQIAADYEFMLRALKKHNASISYTPKTIVKMREGGFSARDLSHRIKGWKELRRAWKINNIKIPLFFSLLRPLFKISQYKIIKHTTSDIIDPS
jgi:glycosyltransferase involved in cell wall biosynthesis